jgi:hypothetical protein
MLLINQTACLLFIKIVSLSGIQYSKEFGVYKFLMPRLPLINNHSVLKNDFQNEKIATILNIYRL